MDQEKVKTVDFRKNTRITGLQIKIQVFLNWYKTYYKIIENNYGTDEWNTNMFGNKY